VKILEKEINKLKTIIEISFDARISYLEENYSKVKELEPSINSLTGKLDEIKDFLSTKESNKREKDRIEIA
jgi:hypothetical protein